MFENDSDGGGYFVSENFNITSALPDTSPTQSSVGGVGSTSGPTIKSTPTSPSSLISPGSSPTSSQTTSSTSVQPPSSHLTAILTSSIIIGGAIIILLIAWYIRKRRSILAGRLGNTDTQIRANESDDTGQANSELHQMNGLASDMSPSEENGANMFTQDVSSKICATLKVEDFTVGWICALSIEKAAAIATFDETYTKLEQHSSDHNIYALGRIGQHNVVVACLRAGVVGSTSAAIVATQMLFSFPSIRFGLMVGIGGGAPSPNHDIRLGDVVVSIPQDKYGGVVQYDFGKTIADGRFILTGQLNKPPSVLLGAVAALRSTHELEDNKLAQYLTEMVKRHPKLQSKYTYQELQNDRLFDAEYEHESNSDTCDHCDHRRLLHRPARCVPAVHYGLIASANNVMKDASTRDKLRDELGVLCFEMEAAGLIDTFPCLVIRGICDYADSHKNKRWQEYAAAVAAAYTKELLSVITARQVTSTATATATTQPGRSSS